MMDFEFVHPTLETILGCQEEVPTSLIEQDGRTYMDIELITSLIDLTLQNNMDIATQKDKPEIIPYLTFLATTMQFMPDLMMYRSMQRQLEQGVPSWE